MVSALEVALSALAGFQKKADATANNVANVNSDGFKKSRVDFAESEAGGVEATVRRIDEEGARVTRQDGEVVESSNVDLAGEFVGLITAHRGFEANLKTVRAEEEMTGYLLDIFG